MTDTRRIELIQVRLTPAEKDQIRQAAGGTPVSAYVRQVLLGDQPTSVREKTMKTTEQAPSPPKKSIADSPKSPSRAKPNFRPI